jgi:hypothetical protein
MKHLVFLAIAAAAAVAIVDPGTARAAQTQLGSATVCGRVNAPSETIRSVILPDLTLAIPPANIIIARSQSEVVRGQVGLNGTYCFENLHTDMHVISAFGDESLDDYSARVLPVAGETVYADLNRPVAI